MCAIEATSNSAQQCGHIWDRDQGSPKWQNRAKSELLSAAYKINLEASDVTQNTLGSLSQLVYIINLILQSVYTWACTALSCTDTLTK